MHSGQAATVGVLLSLALIMPGCGAEGATADGERTTGPTDDAAKSGDSPPVTRVSANAAPAVARRCGRMLGSFLDSLESLNNTLAVGMDYEGYLDAVNNVRAIYSRLPVERLPPACLVLVGAPAEGTLNIYIDAANTWGDCLATTSCDPESVEPKLQRKWEQASGYLSVVQRELRRLP